ncbi:MAG TPA: NAD-dependent epimerase/dehydratase family protein, partial [Chthoniobacterales bacterium]|nr:NAD-dependent epimerase/dehydratase family protein [Chthoniobacterales bacterium]
MDAALKETFTGEQVLVTGASGFIGWHVADQLVKAGAKVRALVRPATARKEEAFEWFEGDLLRRDSLDAAAKDCRYVFHVAG